MLSHLSLHPAVDEQNKQTQAYQGSVGPSKKDSSEELNKEEERLSKMPVGHVAFWRGMGVSHGMGSGKSTSAAAASLPWPGSRRETVTSASSSVILDRPDTFGSLQFPEDPSTL